MPKNTGLHLVIRDLDLQKSAAQALTELKQDFAATALPLQELIALRSLKGLIVDAEAVRECEGSFCRWLDDPHRLAPVVFLAGPRDASLAAACIEAGVEFYLRFPCSAAELKATLQRLNSRSSRLSEPHEAEGELVFLESPSMLALYGRIQSLAPLEALNILISGETGSGKQEVARLIHHYSKRSQGPFAEIDCAVLPANLIESELFGHEAGAYTDARGRQNGLLEAAQGGTLFLDEIGELPLDAQAKLLRALELRRFRRVGGRDEIDLNVRLVCASNRDLAEEVRQGRFRSDLYYRLNGVGLHVPPLRDRTEDIATLAAFFYSRACGLFGRQAMPLAVEVLGALKAHPWPGNIRELKSLMFRLCALCPAGQPLTMPLLQAELASKAGRSAELDPLRVPTLRELEADLARRALKASGGNKTAAAKLMGISKPTYFRMLKEFGIKI